MNTHYILFINNKMEGRFPQAESAQSAGDASGLEYIILKQTEGTPALPYMMRNFITTKGQNGRTYKMSNEVRF